MHVVERVDRVDDGLDVAVQIETEQFAQNVGDEATRVEHLREQEAVQVEAAQRSVLLVEFERRDFVDVPPVFGQLKVVLTLAFHISRRAYFEIFKYSLNSCLINYLSQVLFTINNIFAERFGDAYAFVGVLARQTIENEIDSFGTQSKQYEN